MSVHSSIYPCHPSILPFVRPSMCSIINYLCCSFIYAVFICLFVSLFIVCLVVCFVFLIFIYRFLYSLISILLDFTTFYGTALTLSLRRGRGGLLQPPFDFSLVLFFALLLRLPYGPFTHPLSRYPCIYEKKCQKFLRWKKLVGGG